MIVRHGIDGSKYKACQFWTLLPGSGLVCNQDCSKAQRLACLGQHTEDRQLAGEEDK